MAILTVPVSDLALAPAPLVEVFAYLSDIKGHRLYDTAQGGMPLGMTRAITDDNGVATFDLTPNEDVDRDNTFYAIDVAGDTPPVVVLKTNNPQTLAEARVFDPATLGPAATLDDLADVSLAGIGSGDALRYSGGVWIPWPWPSGGGSGDKPWLTLSANATLIAAGSSSRYKLDAASAPIAITLPTSIGNMGIDFTLKRVNSGVNNVTIATFGGQTIDGSATWVLDYNESITVSSDNANWMVI